MAKGANNVVAKMNAMIRQCAPGARLNLLRASLPLTTEACEQAFEIRWQRCLHRNGPPAQRMRKAQPPRVEHLALRRPAPTRFIVHVYAFAQQRVAELLQVQPNLMLPTRFQRQLEQRRVCEAFEHAIVRDGMAALIGRPHHATPAGEP